MTTVTDKNQHTQEPDYDIDTLTNEKLLSDHEYDGIRELDNDMPPWLKWLFALSIVFAVVYMVRFWAFRANDLYQHKEFEKEMAAVKTKSKSAEAFEIILLQDAVSLTSGKETWLKICAVCHLADGGGLVGPNMTDDYWIHGNTIDDVFNVITNGVIEQGMLAYKDQLSEKQRLDVASYILAELHGSSPANPKEPQGELIE